MAEKKLTRSDLIKTFLLWETQTEVCLSYERLMSLGFCISMSPVINRLYDTKEEKAEAMKRHLVFFNTENNWGAFIPGLVASMEEDKANGAPINDDLITNVKIGLMGPLAGLGDTITQGLVKTVLLAITVNMALDGYTFAPILFFLLYGAYITGIGIFTFYQGYHVGKNVLDKITDPEIIHKITDCLGLVGMTIAGAMIITNVGIETSLVVKDVAIQDILNEIAPNLLGVATTLGIFSMLKKGVSVFKIIVGLFVIGFACYFLGVL